MKGWTDEQIAHSIRTGTDRTGRPYQPPMAFDFYRNRARGGAGARAGATRPAPV